MNIRDERAYYATKLRELTEDFETMVYVAVTGDGLKEVAENQWFQAIAKRVAKKKGKLPLAGVIPMGAPVRHGMTVTLSGPEGIG